MAPCFALAPRGGEPRLAYLNPMERSEAARSPCAVLGPQELDLPRLARDGAPPEEIWAGAVARVLQVCGVGPGRVALGGCLSSGTAHGAARHLEDLGWELVPGESVTRRLRKRKSGAQIDEIRRVAAGAVEAVEHVARLLAAAGIGDDGVLRADDGAPLRVGDLRAEIAGVLARRGLEQPERNIVAPAEEGAVPHETGSDESSLRAGESLVVDLFPRGRLFADCTRTFCVPRPGEDLPAGVVRAHRLVEDALRRAEELAVPGARGWEMQRKICEHFADHGWPTPLDEDEEAEDGAAGGADGVRRERGDPVRGYVHGLGHGVGAELHELPVFARHASEAEGRLESGDVLTLEPGLYEPQPADGPGWAVRLEDTYVVTGDGVESLTPLPRHLDPRAW